MSDELGAVLCKQERARAKRFARQRDGELWVASRGLLRALIGRYLQSDPRALVLAASAHGKLSLLEDAPSADPAADSTPSSSRLSFNLSHSEGLALYAFAADTFVGVDVEVTRRPIDEPAIAARALGAHEARRLEGLDPATRQRELLRVWTRHEATLKCLGTGIGGRAPRRFEPWLAELEMGPSAAGAVAVEHPARELRCWNWARRSSRRSGGLSTIAG